MGKQQASLGEWQSPISSELIVSKVLRIGSPSVLANGDITWVEMRPSEQGRSVLTHRSAADGSVRDITPEPSSGFNVRTRVHEYGGGEHLVVGGKVYFSNFADQLMYVQDLSPGSRPVALTAADAKQRFANYVLDEPRNRLLAVCEDHNKGDDHEATNSIAAIDLSSGAVTQLVTGHDFFSSPVLSPDGSRLAYVAWDHPNMPWDDVLLLVTDLDEAGLPVGGPKLVAGGSDTSVQQPQWGPDGTLYFVSDASGWWNLYRTQPEQDSQPTALMPLSAEFGSPPWLFGMHSYEVLQGGAAVLAVFDEPAAAGSQLGVIDTATSSLTRLSTGYSSFGKLAVLQSSEGLTAVTVAGSPSTAQALVKLQVSGLDGLLASSASDWQVLKPSTDLQLDPGYISEPRSIEFPTQGGVTAFMNFYPPTNKHYEFPLGQLPALLVKIHGGPTSAASTLFSIGYQFWTSRGFAIADVNYGGSTGFGRAYRSRLRGNWGVTDVDDCCAAARYLADEGLVDGSRLCIDGGSAGGYTTLAALAFRDVFNAGASHYGVADAELLAQHTHKFESRYLDLLIGPYPADKELYQQRSPIHSADKISAPVALFQGDEDKIVPPEQSEAMWEALKAKGLPTTLMMYKGEQHGFRKAENIRSALEGEMYFYGRVLGFNASYSPELQAMAIDNLPEAAAGAPAAAAREEL
ncbi:Alpha/Beta hydrolase protein [Scenedesmus sp. NREL 46B-D3]|nr:Alpha/Beta hydrolase protein [Scenedesmus sp. NREL 46B-D3]